MIGGEIVGVRPSHLASTSSYVQKKPGVKNILNEVLKLSDLVDFQIASYHQKAVFRTIGIDIDVLNLEAVNGG